MFRSRHDEDRKPIQQEIAELQRKFRVLENDKRAYSEDSQSTIRKQRATIEKLTRENRKMKVELNESRGGSSSQAENKMAIEQVGKLTDQQDKLQRQTEAEKELGQSLTDKLETNRKTIMSLRQELASNGGINAALDNSKAVQKQIRILENRLDKALQKFNDAIAANRTLRESIDTLRRERCVFDDIYRKLENELQQKKKEMANIIEQANAAYEARDSAQAQMAGLKQQADKEHAEFEKEWRELGRLVENDKRMKEFMKSKVRAQQDAKNTDTGPKDVAQHTKKVTRNAWDTAKSLVSISVNEEKLAAYEDAFEKIQKATGISDIDDLVHNFLNAEDQNFSLFKYNNELSADIEKLEQQIGEFRDEYVHLSGTSSRKEDTEKVKILEGLEEKWNDIDRKGLQYEIKYQEAQQILAHLRTGVESIFWKLGCTADDLPSGCGVGISEANMMTYLGLVEQRTNELLKLHAAMQGDDDDFQQRPGKSGNASSNYAIKLPSTVEDYSDDEDEEDDDDQRPFTRDELKTRTLRGINRRQKKGKTAGRN